MFRTFLAVMMMMCAAAWGQTDGDPKPMQALMQEVQMLRLAIERSTLLGARTQLAISQLQVQEGKSERLAQQLAALQAESINRTGQRNHALEGIKHLEASRTLPEFTAPERRQELDMRMQQLKSELTEMDELDKLKKPREAELSMQVQLAQTQVAEARNRITEMETLLDQAINQILKPR